VKRNVIAAALSGILPGLGQFYNRQWLKGIGFLVSVLVLSAFIRPEMLLPEQSPTALLTFVVLLGLAIWSVVDAYRSDKSTHSHDLEINLMKPPSEYSAISYLVEYLLIIIVLLVIIALLVWFIHFIWRLT